MLIALFGTLFAGTGTDLGQFSAVVRVTCHEACVERGDVCDVSAQADALVHALFADTLVGTVLTRLCRLQTVSEYSFLYVSMTTNTVYRSSDGDYYGDVEIWERLESGTWTPCCWDTESGKEWMETRDGELLILEPISQNELPESVQTERVTTGTAVKKENSYR
nr:hypothetical protein [Halogranum amylolyticum]